MTIGFFSERFMFYKWKFVGQPTARVMYFIYTPDWSGVCQLLEDSTHAISMDAEHLSGFKIN